MVFAEELLPLTEELLLLALQVAARHGRGSPDNCTEFRQVFIYRVVVCPLQGVLEQVNQA